MMKTLRLIFVVTFTCSLFNGCSSNLFYMPRDYSAASHLQLLNDPVVVKIGYQLGEEAQTAFYIGGDAPPEQLWLLLSGINSLALDWHQWFYQAVSENTGFLFVDFPGYGLNEGVPRAEKMFRSTIAAYDALMQKFEEPQIKHSVDLNVMGHSLGTGVATDFASKMPVKKLLLIAPFTNMEELVIYRYGKFQGSFLNMINPEEYMNDSKLKLISAKQNPPQIFIIHGVDDKVIPVEMGRKMAAISPALTTYYEIDDIGHKNIFAEHLELILSIIRNDP